MVFRLLLRNQLLARCIRENYFRIPFNSISTIDLYSHSYDYDLPDHHLTDCQMANTIVLWACQRFALWLVCYSLVSCLLLCFSLLMHIASSLILNNLTTSFISSTSCFLFFLLFLVSLLLRPVCVLLLNQLVLLVLILLLSHRTPPLFIIFILFRIRIPKPLTHAVTLRAGTVVTKNVVGTDSLPWMNDASEKLISFLSTSQPLKLAN